MAQPACGHPSSTSGHGPYPPTVTTGGSGNVFVEGKPLTHVGVGTVPHTDPGPPETHGSSVSAGSSSVNVNSQPASRIGDAIGCGDALASGSGTVFIGD
jgi:uncharacterized Zn-binding protein involved in type VI secretion